jgi:hypothetical protein
MTYLLKVLQQVDYAALDLILGQASGGRVEANGLRLESRDNLRWASSRGDLDLVGSRGPDSSGNRGSQGAHHGRAEHYEGEGKGKASAWLRIETEISWRGEVGSEERKRFAWLVFAVFVISRLPAFSSR